MKKLFITTFLVFVLLGNAEGAIALVQEKIDGDLDVPAVTLAATATSGNLIVTALGVDKGASSIAVPTNFTLINDFIGSSVSGAFAYKVSDGTEDTITWTVGSCGAGCAVWAGEYSDVNTLDDKDENDSEPGAVYSLLAGSIDTTVADEVIVTMAAVDSASNVDSPTWDQSLDELEDWGDGDGPGGEAGLSIGQRIVSSTGNYYSTCAPGGGNDQIYGAIASFYYTAPPAARRRFF